jgi:hypothetical protein
MQTTLRFCLYKRLRRTVWTTLPDTWRTVTSVLNSFHHSVRYYSYGHRTTPTWTVYGRMSWPCFWSISTHPMGPIRGQKKKLSLIPMWYISFERPPTKYAGRGFNWVVHSLYHKNPFLRGTEREHIIAQHVLVDAWANAPNRNITSRYTKQLPRGSTGYTRIWRGPWRQMKSVLQR